MPGMTCSVVALAVLADVSAAEESASAAPEPPQPTAMNASSDVAVKNGTTEGSALESRMKTGVGAGDG